MYAIDENSNPVMMSIKPYDSRLTAIVRTKEGSQYRHMDTGDSSSIDHVAVAREIYPDLQVTQFDYCTNLKVGVSSVCSTLVARSVRILLQAQQFIKTYDEKLETHKFKFGVIYQKRGQVSIEMPIEASPSTDASRRPKKSSSITNDTAERWTSFSTSSLRECL